MISKVYNQSLLYPDPIVPYPLTRKNTVVERKNSILVLSIIVDPEIKFMSIDSHVINSNFVAIHLLYQNK